MQFKLDENLHDDVAMLLTKAGHDVHTVLDEGLRGASDSLVAQHCSAENRVLVTLDLDFADIRTYPPSQHTGPIVLRVRNQSRRHILPVMGSIVSLLEREAAVGRLWIVSEAGVRIRQ